MCQMYKFIWVEVTVYVYSKLYFTGRHKINLCSCCKKSRICAELQNALKLPTNKDTHCLKRTSFEVDYRVFFNWR